MQFCKTCNHHQCDLVPHVAVLCEVVKLFKLSSTSATAELVALVQTLRRLETFLALRTRKPYIFVDFKPSFQAVNALNVTSLLPYVGLVSSLSHLTKCATSFTNSFVSRLLKTYQLQGGKAPLTRGVAPGPHWGQRPQYKLALRAHHGLSPQLLNRGCAYDLRPIWTCGRCKQFWNFSIAFFAMLSFLDFFHVISVLTVFACFSFSSLHHSK